MTSPTRGAREITYRPHLNRQEVIQSRCKTLVQTQSNLEKRKKMKAILTIDGKYSE